MRAACGREQASRPLKRVRRSLLCVDPSRGRESLLELPAVAREAEESAETASFGRKKRKIRVILMRITLLLKKVVLRGV